MSDTRHRDEARPVRAAAMACLAVATLAGCAGTWTSSRPVYPQAWPVIATAGSRNECPDVSGTWRAVSDAAAPLEYPPGGHPRQMVMGVTYGPPVPLPALGRRVLTWHLAGHPAGKTGSDPEWIALERFAARVNPGPSVPADEDAAGWVRIRRMADGVLDVAAGVRQETMVTFTLAHDDAPSIWTHRKHVYQCKEGALTIAAGFPAPAVENPSGSPLAVGAWVRFHRAADGSLVMLEEPYFGVVDGTLLFKKWWRWRTTRGD